MAAREEGGIDSSGEPDVGGSVGRMGRGGCYEGVGDSRFLTGLSARFGMTNLFSSPTRNDEPFYPWLSREFEAVGLAEQVPGFAVGIIDVGFAAAFGA
jgi:hypothetical protein